MEQFKDMRSLVDYLITYQVSDTEKYTVRYAAADVTILETHEYETTATGGKITKLEAAELATSHGIDVLVTNGKNPEKLYDIIEKKKVGTLFVAKED